MALINWDDEEKKKKEEELYSTPITRVASVQEGAWQPAPSGADSAVATDDATVPQPDGGDAPQPQGNYLLSDEKAQVDAQKRQRDIEIENARRAAAAQQIAAQQRAAQQNQMTTRQGQPVDVNAVKQDEGWKKYYGQAFQTEKNDLDFFGRLLDNGQASKRAEVLARARYQAELQRNGQADKAAQQGAYNSSMAMDNSARARALAQASGALTPNANFGDKVRGTLNTLKTASIYDSLAGVDNKNGFSIGDIGRFPANLLQGIPTMPLTGAKELYEGARGRGTDEATGLEKELTGLERAGRGASGALNVVTPFVGGSGKLLDSVTTKAIAKTVPTAEKMVFNQLITKAATTGVSDVESAAMKQILSKAITNTADVASKTALQKLTAQILLPAIEQGAIGGAQSGAEYFGQGRTLTDENGNIDTQKLKDFGKQTGVATAMGVGGGLLMGGGAMGIRRLRNGKPIPAGELADLESRATLANEAEMANTRRNEVPGENIRALENGEVTPVREPIVEGRAKTEEMTPIRNEVEQVPTEKLPSDPRPVSVKNDLIGSSANDITPVGKIEAIKNKVSDIKERLRLKDEAGGNAGASDEPTVTNALTGKETPNPTYKPVADGTAQVTPVKNIPEANVAPIKSEEVRALQESKAGASQAEEAVINQKLKEVENSKPALKGKDIGSVFDDPEIAKSRNDTNTFLKNAKSLRENYPGGDKKFLDDVIYGNVEAKGKVGEFARSVAKADATEVGRSYSISDMLDDYMAPIDAPSVSKSNLKDAHLQDLKSEMIKLAKNSNQPELRRQAFSAMKDMDIDGQIDYLASGLKNARDNGVQAMLYAKEQFGAPSPKPEARPTVEPKSIPENAKPVKELPQPKFERDLDTGKMKYKTPEKPTPITDKSIPKVDSTPEGMNTDVLPGTDTPSGSVADKQGELVDRAISTLDEPKQYIQEVASAISEDGKSPIKADDMRETLDMYGDKGNSALKERIATKYERLKEITNEMNKPQLENRKNLKEGGIEAGNAEITKSRSELQKERGRLEKDLGGDIKKLVAQTSGKAKASLIYNNLKNYRKSNMLFGASNIERQAPQDILGLLNDVVKNPKLMGKALKTFPKEYIKSIHNAARDWAIPPKTISEIPKYVLGNAYESAMSLVGVEGAVRARTNAYRNVEARNILSKLGYDITKENIDKMSKMMGNEAELMAHTAAGVANFMTSNTQFKKASDAYNAYLDGNPLERTKFLDNVAKQSTVAAQIKQQLFKSDNPMAHIAAEVIDFVAPFVRTASNAFDTTITQTLNPFSKTAADYILRSERSTGRNALASAQNAAMDGAMIAGTVGLIGAGRIVYNNGDDVDKPRGISIKVDDTHYVPIRAAHVELAVATVYVATQMVKDINSGDFNASSVKDYMGILDNSLPYVDSLANTNRAIGSATSGDEGDNNYAAKSYGLNTAKSFVPASNNGVEPWMARNQGNSMDAKSTYNKDPAKWFGNILNNSYGRGDYLPVSRDAAGRARTSDSQGAFINKTINDVNTKEFNSRVTDLVKYGQKNGLGKGTQDMFNTFDNGKNNNFRTISGQIWGMTGKGGNETKLQKNEKLAGLAKQQREGFFGTTGSDLLTLDGQNLYSDVSMPNADGTKNSSKPISMQSIKNAIAATDLTEAERNRMYEISQANQALYSKVQSKEMTYDQYKAVKAQSEKEYVSILSNSESYKKMTSLFNELDGSGFFKPDGLGSTKSGQTYLWNALNALLGSKGKTPAADYPKDSKGFTPWGKRGGGGRKGSGFGATNKPGDRGTQGIKWTPVGKRQMATTASSKYTPVNIKVKLGNAIKKDKSQNYTDRNF